MTMSAKASMITVTSRIRVAGCFENLAVPCQPALAAILLSVNLPVSDHLQ